DATAGQALGEVGRHATAESRFAHRDAEHPPPRHLGSEAAHDGLDLGQLGHDYAKARARRAKASRSSVSARAVGTMAARANTASAARPRCATSAASALRSIFRRCPKGARTTRRRKRTGVAML